VLFRSPQNPFEMKLIILSVPLIINLYNKIIKNIELKCSHRQRQDQLLAHNHQTSKKKSTLVF